ncbi:MAG: Peptidoglycan/LPS O-acetylase OafA/YrhL, contains acyltransferase and SGNH-hydrolase domain [Herminiimonas sp.]|nr:Peptidoglycan/LPS O-acetylase OafA/YrhL, contains acyltransferase and SGNH-hydrolase domain [Herminiimonas sp.]
MSDAVASVNRRLKRFSEVNRNVHYFDATPYLCPKGICSTHLQDTEQIYFDKGHLSIPGSWRLGEDVYAKEGVPKAFSVMKTTSSHAITVRHD